VGEITFRPIGIIHTPFKESKGTPIQPSSGKGVVGTVEVFEQYVQGLRDLDGFSHITLIYHFHLSGPHSLLVTPFMDDKQRGVFATRAPRRPNAIGISVVCLVRVDGNVLHVQDLDIIDGTPLLDIKPYVPGFDQREVWKTGWLEKRISKLSSSRDDGRFSG
jgi:tRNA-Thr(GGU) m(6)t(6)A37 methyltransferase TsaA